jgi:hypothetical protein
MAPKFNLRETLVAAIKESIHMLFPAVKTKPGRPKETTTETPDQETEQSIASALEEAHREREQPSPSSSERQKRKDPRPASKEVSVAPIEAKRRRVNWSKDDNRAKLEAALLKWKEGGALDENGGALSMTEFANIVGIPPRTLYTYASGKQKVGARKKRKSAVSKTAYLKPTVPRERVEMLEANLVIYGDAGLRSDIKTVDRILERRPTDQSETSIPVEPANNAPNLNLTRTFTVCRKAAKRTESWYHKPPPPQNIAAPSPSPQAELIPARKKQRVDESFPATVDEDARKTGSPGVSVGLPPAAADNDDGANVNADPVTDTQPNAGATTVIIRWTPEEDTKLTSAVTNTRKKKRGNEHKTDWKKVAGFEFCKGE